MGLSDFFSPGGTKTSSTSYLPIQATGLNKTLGLYLDELGKNLNVYPGQRVAGMADLQTDVLSAAPNFLSVFGNPVQAGQPLNAETGESIKQLLSGAAGGTPITPEQEEQYYQNKLYQPTVRNFQDVVMPAVNEGYTGGNFFSTARGKAGQKAATDVSNYLTKERANLGWNVNQANQALAEGKASRMLATVPQAMQYGRAPAEQTLNNLRIAAGQVAGMGDLFGFGQAQQTQEQKEIEATIAKWAEDHQITDPANLAVILSLLGMNFQTSKSETTAPGIGASFLGSLAGSAGQTLGGGVGSFLTGKYFPTPTPKGG